MDETSNIRAEESNQKLSSLEAIAVQYDNCDSDVESDSVDSDTEREEKMGEIGMAEEQTDDKEAEIVTVHDNTNYRANALDDSSSDETDSEESDDTSESSSSSDADDSDSDESRTGNVNQNRKKVGNQASRGKDEKNELDNLPPIGDLKISVPEVLCEPFGEVAWTVEQLVIVRPKEGKPTLNLDTVLFVDRGQRALGKIFDVFGQVNEPHYCIRFNSSKHIEESNIKVGMTTYYCPNTQYTSLVFLHELVKIKGSDAVDDDEPPEFSDDEEERAYYESLKQKNDQNKTEKDPSCKRRRISGNSTNWQSNHPWNKNRNPRVQKTENYHVRNSHRHSDNTWPSTSFSYSNNPYWSMMQSPMYPDYSQNGYPVFPNELCNADRDCSSSGTQENYCNRDRPSTHNQRIPFGASPQFPPGVPPHYRATFPVPNARFPYVDPSWQSHAMPFPIRPPWGPPHLLPPPPPPSFPPPPPPSRDNK